MLSVGVGMMLYRLDRMTCWDEGVGRCGRGMLQCLNLEEPVRLDAFLTEIPINYLKNNGGITLS
jgi:hypothetical protein